MWFDYLLSFFSIYLVISLVAATHALLNVRDSRAAFGWLGLIGVFPIAGALLYALFGINRVRRKAQRISQDTQSELPKDPIIDPLPAGVLRNRPGFNISGIRLVEGNRVSTLYNGEQAFPEMLSAIEKAQKEVLLCSYIFDNDDTGRLFVERLVAARDRGCAVRVLIDDVGIRYSLPTIIRELRQHDINHRRFMPLKLLPPSFSINLRTHRKMLITDRSMAFAGGMNIGDRQLVHGESAHRASDLHFKFEGPVTRKLVELFADDWKYSRGKPLDAWEAAVPTDGQARCRVISDGPDDTLDSMMLVIMGAIASARVRAWIMTPYFLPERQMLGCLQAAALAGVDVQVMIPEKNNWPVVQWALQHNMAELLDAGVKILRQPPPFAHSKCIMIDDDYSLVGSSNLDPRSLRLNFELGVEVFEPELNEELAAHFLEKLDTCRPFTSMELKERKTIARLRDSASALFTPYL
ncbi:MAG: phospholipase D-like domain-containing protein [Xanthomonadales bacterium]|nr:phospholipase D-like domain-containing protein [Xanthomonadales bacterium]